MSNRTTVWPTLAKEIKSVWPAPQVVYTVTFPEGTDQEQLREFLDAFWESFVQLRQSTGWSA